MNEHDHDNMYIIECGQTAPIILVNLQKSVGQRLETVLQSFQFLVKSKDSDYLASYSWSENLVSDINQCYYCWSLRLTSLGRRVRAVKGRGLHTVVNFTFERVGIEIATPPTEQGGGRQSTCRVSPHKKNILNGVVLFNLVVALQHVPV